MQLRKFQRLNADELSLLWDDGHTEIVSLRKLRDACPCAGCKGETLLMHHYGPPAVDYDAAGRYELVSASPVGNYAIKLVWGDKHADGMYTWVLLRALCECAVCRAERGELAGDGSPRGEGSVL
jgi:DUF971 family protein